jgi:hypothetical protein
VCVSIITLAKVLDKHSMGDDFCEHLWMNKDNDWHKKKRLKEEKKMKKKQN